MEDSVLESGNNANKPKNANSKVVGRWTNEEHKKFLEARCLYKNDWKLIEKYLGTRTAAQARSHAQKYFRRIKRAEERAVKADSADSNNSEKLGNKETLKNKTTKLKKTVKPDGSHVLQSLIKHEVSNCESNLKNIEKIPNNEKINIKVNNQDSKSFDTFKDFSLPPCNPLQLNERSLSQMYPTIIYQDDLEPWERELDIECFSTRISQR